jgi:hypothetical protein
MLSMCSVSAAQAETYYDKDDYYTQGTDPSQTLSFTQKSAKWP